jgi:hypothetical protein
MIRRTLIIVACFITFFFSDIQKSFSAAPEAVFKDWSVFKIKQDKKDVCYIASTPINREGNYRERGEPFATIIRVKGSKYDEINFSSGYIYDKNKSTEVAIGNKKFVLFVYEERAWAVNKEDDIAIVNTMRKGYKIKLSGYSKLGTYSVDTFSLIGFTDAYNKMVELCK